VANLGKIQRLVRELVAVLVDEFGREIAADTLERTAAQVRGAGARPKRATEQAQDVVKDRQRTVARR